MRILYIDIDTLRPDHLGCYGYHRDTSPNIDKIAAEGVTFHNYYASDTPCLPSRSAMMSGRFGIHNGAINHGGTAAELRHDGPSRSFTDKLLTDSLPGFLSDELGMHTCYIGGFGARHSAWGFYAGFKEIHDTGQGGDESAHELNTMALDWIERKARQDDWFLHIHYWDPHTPYRVPQDFGNPFENEPLDSWYTQERIDDHMKRPGPHSILDIGLSGYDDDMGTSYPRQPGQVTNMQEMKQLIDGYDCGIRYADHHIGLVLKALEEQNVLDDLMIIVSSDHGENFGELGLYAEHATADQACNRIPMIIRMPQTVNQGHTDSGLHYNLDLSPTLAELFGKTPRPDWDGQSYAKTLTEGTDTGHSELVLGQCAHGVQRSVRWDDWIYIKTWHDGFHNFDDEMLFNLKDDPREEHNLASAKPDIVRIGQKKYQAWHEEMMHSMPEGHGDPLETVMEEGPLHCRGDMRVYAQRLRDTGREQALDVLKQKHPEAFK